MMAELGFMAVSRQTGGEAEIPRGGREEERES